MSRRTALVTGGARGIGRAIVADLARDHDVAFTWNSTEPEGTGAWGVQADFTKDGTAAQVVDAVLDRFGRIDVIVNNAGIVAMTPKEVFDPAAHRAIFDVNYLAAVGLLSAALPHLEPGAAIVNISSTNAELPPRDAVTYGASKAAINLWTRGMAKELGPRGIRVNAVAPGPIELPEAPRPPDLVQAFLAETAIGRVGRPEDIARAVRFLASEDADFITGTILDVNGGYRL